MKCIARIQAGVCGFTTTVTADAPDDQMVCFEFETDCKKIAGLADVLRGKEVDAYAEVGAGHDGVVMTAVRSSLSGCCAGCAVPVGVFKAMQAAAAVALPRDVTIVLEKG
jgi:Family of unknown function (DUF6951)